jgi:hypothetical protein
MHDDDVLARHKANLAALSDVEGHMHKRLELITRALVPATSGEFQVFDDPALEYCEAKAGSLFKAAWGNDVDAVAALSLIASSLLHRGKPLPPMLAAVVSVTLHEVGYLKPKRGRGRYSPYDHVTRDISVIRRIQTVCVEQGLSPMRNDAEKDPDDPTGGKPCGCSVVAYELGMEERALEEIWGNRRQYGIP